MPLAGRGTQRLTDNVDYRLVRGLTYTDQPGLYYDDVVAGRNADLIQEYLDAAALNGTGAQIIGPKDSPIGAGAVILNKPLHINKASFLFGAKGGGTSLLFYHGSGYGLNVRGVSTRVGLCDSVGNPSTGAALATGGGVSARLGAGRTFLSGRTEPLADLSGQAAVTIEAWIKPVSLPADGVETVLFHSYADWGIAKYRTVSLRFKGSDGTLRLYWNTPTDRNNLNVNVGHDTAAGVVAAGVGVHVALVFAGSTVKLYVGGQQRLSFAAGVSTFPMQPNGVEPLLFGSADTEDGADGVAPAEYYVDGIRLSKVARYSAPFSPPTAKFSADSNSRLLVNFTHLERDWVRAEAGVVGGAGHYAWLLAEPADQATADFTGGGASDLSLTCTNGASAINVTSPNSECNRVQWNNAWIGYALRGLAFGHKSNNCGGSGTSFGFYQGDGQSVQCDIRNMSPSGSAFTVCLNGACGGTYRNWLITPHADRHGMIYIAGTEEPDWIGCVSDDETPADTPTPNVLGGVIMNGAAARFHGGRISLPSAQVPAFRLGGLGGSVVKIYGTALYCAPGTAEIIKFDTAPTLGDGFQLSYADPVSVGDSTVPMTLTPQYLEYRRNGVLYTPGAVKVANAYTLPTANGSQGFVLRANANGLATFAALPKIARTAPGMTADDLYAAMVAGGYAPLWQFQPNDLTGLVDSWEPDPIYWFKDQAATVPVTADGDVIKAWVGRFNGVKFATAGTHITAKFVGGRWLARFDGAGQLVAGPGVGPIVSPVWFFVTANDATGAGGGPILATSGYPTSFELNRGGSAGNVLLVTSAGNILSTSGYTQGTPHVLTAKFKSGSPSLQVDNGTPTTGSQTFTGSNGYLQISASDAGGAVVMDCYGVAVVLADLVSGDVDKMRTYMGNEAGLSL